MTVVLRHCVGSGFAPSALTQGMPTPRGICRECGQQETLWQLGPIYVTEPHNRPVGPKPPQPISDHQIKLDL